MDTLLVKNGKRIGYLTGLKLYNELRLTTQLYHAYDVASSERLTLDWYKDQGIKVYTVKSYVPVTDENYKMLQFLDLFRYFPSQPLDLNRRAVIAYFIHRLQKMSEEEQKLVVTFALSYPPRIRAFLGALLEQGGIKKYLKKLKKSLNPMSTYRLHANRYDLPTAKKWNLYDDLTRKRTAISTAS